MKSPGRALAEEVVSLRLFMPATSRRIGSLERAPLEGLTRQQRNLTVATWLN